MGISEAEFLRRATSSRHEGGRPPFWGVEIDDLSIVRRTFGLPLDLSGAIFLGPVRFVECRFIHCLGVRSAAFRKGATFFDCCFVDGADFSWAMFWDRCYFWRSQFEGPARFDNCVVKPAEQTADDEHSYLRPAETNFSWTRFSSTASFFRMQFGGPAWFWRPVFVDGADFTEAKFGGAFRFHGARQEVCIGESDLQHSHIFQGLLAKQIVVPDPETTPPRYGHFEAVATREDLVTRLKVDGFSAAEITHVSDQWLRWSKPTLPRDPLTSFQSMTFEFPDQAEFSQVDLGGSLLLGTNVRSVVFSKVTWDRRRFFLGGLRPAVRDESEAASKGFDGVHHLYGQLEANYSEKGAYAEASGFRYGKMEMARRNQHPVLRYISVIAGYKYLSGYGERYGLALALLLLFVLVLFPALYLIFGFGGGPVAAALHSLEISTFLQSSDTSDLTTPARFTEGAERIVIPVQAGLVVLAVNRRLGRA